jgi:nucleoside-diphosphate-sugar epimerase
VFEFFRMVGRGIALIPAGERWITVIHAADAIRGLLAAASTGRPRRIYHLGETDPYRVEEMILQIAAAGDRSVRIIRVPATVVSGMGTITSSMRRLRLMRGALTRDKAREIVARHWTARSSDSLDALGLDITVRFAEGARATWAWYRSQGWLS